MGALGTVCPLFDPLQGAPAPGPPSPATGVGETPVTRMAGAGDPLPGHSGAPWGEVRATRHTAVAWTGCISPTRTRQLTSQASGGGFTCPSTIPGVIAPKTVPATPLAPPRAGRR